MARGGESARIERKPLERTRPVCLGSKSRNVLLARGRSLGSREPASSAILSALWEAARVGIHTWHHARRVWHGPWASNVSECPVGVVSVAGCRIGRSGNGRTLRGIWARKCGRRTTSPSLAGCSKGCRGLLRHIRAALSPSSSTASPNGTRTDPTWRLQTERRAGE
jgi:hypothetical protein